MSFTQFVSTFWQDITGWLLLLEVVITLATLSAVLHIKRDPMSAIAWSLTVILVPFLGAFLFLLFGFQHVHRPLMRQKRKRTKYKQFTARTRGTSADVPEHWVPLAKIAHHGDGFPVSNGNAVTLYHEGAPAFDAMLEAIASAKHHVHMASFIFRNDESGRRFIAALCECARRKVEVRLLVDSVGSYSLSSRLLKQLVCDGGQAAAFLTLLNPFNRLRVNLRNHRKILVVDGHTGFSGGLNVGDEYLGKHRKFGYWRDTHFCIRGPAVEGLQHTFLEDWYFTTGKGVKGGMYYPEQLVTGNTLAQVVASGPDTDFKAIRETYVSAVLKARQRVWIASPYFVPDAGFRDAILLAARSGVDVRFLGLFRPDKWIPFLAARYYWSDMLDAGVTIYQYTRGMMHSKFMLVDNEWASVGSANTDNRSLFLNFELNCQFFDTDVVKELELAFLEDLKWSVRLDPQLYPTRPLVSRLAENACRLFSPIL